MSEETRLPPGKKLRYVVEAAGFFLVIGFFRLFPVDRASALGGWIGRHMAAHGGTARTARRHLEAAFPEMPHGERAAILNAMWDNLGRVMAEYAHLGSMRWHRENPRLTVTGLENFDAAAAKAKGLMLVSGHFANWEVMPFAAREHGLTGATVVRPVNNPIVARWLARVRARHGMTEEIAKGAAGLRRIFTLLRKGETICMLVDQRTSEGIPAPFFGRDAMTTPAPAALAIKLGTPIVPVSNRRVNGAHFHLHVYPMIEPPRTGDDNADLIMLTAAINAFIEARVKDCPEQWLWIHRRWPKGGSSLRRRAQALVGRGAATSNTSSRV